jgi:hypothetical protein
MGLRVIVCVVVGACFSSVASASLITFDTVVPGPTAGAFLSQGVEFFVGNGTSGASTGLLDVGGSSVTASVLSAPGTAFSGSNLLIPRFGTNEDIWVYFFDPAGNRITAEMIGIRNDLEGSPAVVIEAFDIAGASLGSNLIGTPGGLGEVTASGIFAAKIYGSPGSPGFLGVDDFSFVLTVPAPSPILTMGMCGFVLSRRRRHSD